MRVNVKMREGQFSETGDAVCNIRSLRNQAENTQSPILREKYKRLANQAIDESKNLLFLAAEKFYEEHKLEFYPELAKPIKPKKKILRGFQNKYNTEKIKFTEQVKLETT